MSHLTGATILSTQGYGVAGIAGIFWYRPDRMREAADGMRHCNGDAVTAKVLCLDTLTGVACQGWRSCRLM